MTPKELIDEIDNTLGHGDEIPGVRNTFRYEGIGMHMSGDTVVEIQTNAQDAPIAQLFPEVLMMVYRKLCKEPKYFTGTSRNSAFQDLVDDALGKWLLVWEKRGHRPGYYPGRYTTEAYYIAVIEELLERRPDLRV